MIGQTKLLNKLKSYNLNTFPKTLLLVGERGSGKHLITQYIQKDVLNLPLLDITEKISDEFIAEIYRCPAPTIYSINVSEMTEKEQNILLKLIEEPASTAFIILLCESKALLLNTVVNRCMVFELEPYTKEELSNFIKDETNKDLILNIVKTPGKILECTRGNWQALMELCNKMATKMSTARFDNTLSIANKINYKEEYDKFDFDIFLDFLVFTLFNEYLTSNNKNIYAMYLTLVNARKKLVDKRVNKQIWLENTLIKMWRDSRGY